MTNNIKVLHTEWSDGWGGQEIRIINEMIAIREQGVEVFLACRDHSIIKQKAIELNIHVFVLPFRGNVDFKTMFALIKIVKNNKIDIVNTHSGKDTWVGGIAAKLSGAKFIRTRHLSNRIKSSRLNFINELADYIFTTGESVRTDMIEYNRINPKKILSIPTGIDDEMFDPNKYVKSTERKKFNFGDEDIIIGIVAVLRAFKRHDRFVSVAKRILEENPDKNIKFVIAGDGPRKNRIKADILEKGLEENVIMLGYVSDIPSLLSCLDIFILSSDSKEGVPQSVMQAMLMNKAVISTDAGSTNDLLENNNFILVDRTSEDELFFSCNSLIKNRKYIEDYSLVSRDYISANFSKKIMTEKIIEVYKGLK